MIYRACCQFLQQDIEAHDIEANDMTQGQGQPGLVIESRSGPAPDVAVRQAILASYDVAGDDRRLRDALLQADNADARSLAFDQLRKNYPVRREFSRYRINNANTLDDTAKRYLQALGFLMSPKNAFHR